MLCYDTYQMDQLQMHSCNLLQFPITIVGLQQAAARHVPLQVLVHNILKLL